MLPDWMMTNGYGELPPSLFAFTHRSPSPCVSLYVSLSLSPFFLSHFSLRLSSSLISFSVSLRLSQSLVFLRLSPLSHLSLLRSVYLNLSALSLFLSQSLYFSLPSLSLSSHSRDSL